MRVKGLDDKYYNLKLEYPNLNREVSSNHREAREILKELFPMENIYEEVEVPGSRLRLDFFLPSSKLAIEVHGEQHYTFNPFFQKNKINFMNSGVRDSKKKKFCSLNGFVFIELDHKEKEQWKQQILNQK